MEEEKRTLPASTSLLRIVSPTPSSHRTSTSPPLDQLRRKYDFLQHQLTKLSGTFSLKQKGQQKKNLQEQLNKLENQIKDLESQDSNYPSRQPSPTLTERPDVIFTDKQGQSLEPSSSSEEVEEPLLKFFYEAESVIERPPPELYLTFPPSAFLPPLVLPPVQSTPPPQPPAQVMAVQ